jgi:hypothetical protein
VSALVSVVAFAMFQFTGQYTYFINDLDHRARGLFNEGGPYGLFLTSVILLLLMRRRLYPNGSRLIRWIAFVITLTAWFLSFSKAGVLAGMLCAMAVTFRLDARKRILVGITLPLMCAAFLLFFQQGFIGYVKSCDWRFAECRVPEFFLLKQLQRTGLSPRQISAKTTLSFVHSRPFAGCCLACAELHRQSRPI